MSRPSHNLPTRDKPQLLLSFWAKLGSATYPESFHPLLFHLLDVAAVARQLWDEVLHRP
ncbi:MAG: hypothetical protein FD161_4967, partial [Limisphaerales bacterium]